MYCPLHIGVPRVGVFAPALYLYTADLPTIRLTTVAIFVDDLAVLKSHTDPSSA